MKGILLTAFRVHFVLVETACPAARRESNAVRILRILFLGVPWILVGNYVSTW